MARSRLFPLAAGAVFSMLVALSLAVGEQDMAKRPSVATVESVCPGIASGALTYAVMADLPQGILVRAGQVEYHQEELDQRIGKAPGDLREQMRKNAVFMLDQFAGEKLLLQLAKSGAAGEKAAPARNPDNKLLQAYFRSLVEDVQVTDAEAAMFYKQNPQMWGGATLEQVIGQIKQYLLHGKQQDAVTEHIRTLGQRMTIEVSASWVKENAASAKDNPVDKVRADGKPSLVDFGATGCRPCDMMTPILALLKEKYAGRLNVLFVHVREEQILAARYGVQSIPVQVFFDKDGKEVFRHTGFFPQDEIEKKLSEIGVE